ncbi:MAG: lipopolysaccharide kinase InaA family protein [Phycisphaeraceae bacterium]
MPDRTVLHIGRDHRELLEAHGLADFDALLAAGERAAKGAGSLHKASLPDWRGRARLELPGGTSGGGEDGGVVFIKTYRRPPLSEQVRARLGGARAVADVEWRWAHRLRALGVATPEPVAMGYRRRGAVELASLFVTAEVPGVSLQRYAAEQTVPARCAKRAILTALARLVARLHGAGLFHRDLYLAHIFLSPCVDAGDEATLTLIDLHRIRRARVLALRWRVKDLAALHHSTPAAAATRADRVRWFKLYRGCRRLTRGDRWLIRLIEIKARRIGRHTRKRGL